MNKKESLIETLAYNTGPTLIDKILNSSPTIKDENKILDITKTKKL